MTHSPPPTAPQPSTKNRWIGIVGGIVAAVGIGIYLLNTFTLPSCTSSRATDTLRNILQGQKIEITRIYDTKEVKSSREENTCTGEVESPKGNLSINYRIYWSGWTAQVHVEWRPQRK